MASRRDELNAYVFAKRRLVAQFLHPSPTGSEEGAPRPLRAVLPGLLAGAVGLAGCAAWGLLSPVAPRDWDVPYRHVIVATPSTTRYVVLKTKGRPKLHPVLNMASARLLVPDAEGSVIKVADTTIDESPLLRGATVGIPYAPDRLPTESEVTKPRPWAVCDRAEPGGQAVRTAVFVLAGRDARQVEGRHVLRGGQLLYVRDTDDPAAHYVVDATGTSYPVNHENERLMKLLVGTGEVPHRVSKEWLKTLHRGSPIEMPTVKGADGPSRVRGPRPDLGRVGTLLKGPEGGRIKRYVVLADRVAPVTDFIAMLLLGSGKVPQPPPGDDSRLVYDLTPGAPFRPPGSERWPTLGPSATHPSHGVVCSVLHSVNRSTGRTTLTVWSGPDFPHPLPGSATSAYVTPGSGQLFRQFSGARTDLGPVFLATEAGLRHTIQTKGIAEPGDAGYRDAPSPTAGKGQPQSAMELLGYRTGPHAPIPEAWSSLLPTGPRLSTGAAVQVQGP
ncbi:type VII secretion protein EccB [Streptomyces sp. NBC_00237]|uniref:type VII secretion protein EccB n=1 Tax=Streptomyces sp. NBC_00237 TaxID=2975687 RepID=UPI0022542C25|nr:type VII secretion protein EccB [Streptomyces sp. NBC_00237]MCX5203833.1 type VII secretion protein EccB [Streptomyces sp. NBC_00237]